MAEPQPAPPYVLVTSTTTEQPRRGLLDRDWLKPLTFLLTILAGAAVLWVVWMIVYPLLHIFILFALAAVLAFALASPVNMLTGQMGGRRILAIVLVYLTLAVVVLGGLFLISGPFVRQATALASNLPGYADSLQQQAPQVQQRLDQLGIQTNVDTLKARGAAALAQAGTDVLQNLAGILTGIGGVLVDAFLLIVVSLYLLVDGPSMRRRVVALVPSEQKERVAFFELNASRVFGGYLRGQLTLALIIGVAAGLGCWMLGLPYAVVVGVLAAIFELVPMFGPVLSAIPAVLIALFLPFPKVLWVVLYFLVIQQLENNILAPRISGHAVGLHPLGALFALLVGFQVGGIIGGLFAVPIAGIAWVLVTAAYRESVVEQPRRGWTLPRLRRPPAPPRAA